MEPTKRSTRICLLTDDRKLAIALRATIGPDFDLDAEPHPGSWRVPPADRADVVVLDIDSSWERNRQSETLFNELIESGMPVVIMANDDAETRAQDLVERGAHGCVRKPPTMREFRALLQRAAESHRLKDELGTARRQLEKLEKLTGLDQLTGSSAPMQLVYKLIRKVADLEASVLITGASGTGKELIARAIHNTGNRSKRPFVAVSCAAIPETLIESELLGHEKGAFTGSAATRQGYFEQAGDGTLFLDEIGELKLQTQVKLLRVLQEREFSRLGSGRMIPLRARIVLATHRDLSAMVTAGEFREDLFYRVHVVNIVAPALRQRPSDIPALAQHFRLKYSELYRRTIEYIEPDAMALLERYPWPGNVRELENVIQQAIIMGEGYSIETTDLPQHIQNPALSELEEDLPPNGTFERSVHDYKVKLAADAVQQCRGNKTLAAQSLSISRAYLHRLIRQPMSISECSVPCASAENLSMAG